MIEIERVTWAYPHAQIPSLHEVSLRVKPGEFVVLCGASGSGKSTALRLMNGLVPHFYDDGVLSGRVTVAGKDTSTATLDELGQLTGTVLQHPRKQFFANSVVEELAFAMENFGCPREETRASVDTQLVALSTGVPVMNKLSALSGGQQQQVGIAAASAHHPGILLLDEPSSNLSPDAIDRLHDILRAHKAHGVTVVVAEHRLRYLEDLLDRVIVFSAGRIDAEWSAAEFRGITDHTLAQYGLRGTAQSIDLPVLPAAGLSIAGSIRPTEVPGGALELTDVRCRAGRNTVLAIDRLVFPAGSVTAIRGRNGAGKSTLSRVIAGLRSAGGAIRLNGKTLPPRKRRRATTLVMQDVGRQLFAETVAAEIRLSGFGEHTTIEIDPLLESLDLDHLTDRHPLSLSGGQQQRLVVAGARLSRRPIVIFDEPSSGVDRRHLDSIAAQIRDVAATGAVVLLISHDDDLLARAADQQITLTPLPLRQSAPTRRRPRGRPPRRPLTPGSEASTLGGCG